MILHPRKILFREWETERRTIFTCEARQPFYLDCKSTIFSHLQQCLHWGDLCVLKVPSAPLGHLVNTKQRLWEGHQTWWMPVCWNKDLEILPEYMTKWGSCERLTNLDSTAVATGPQIIKECKVELHHSWSHQMYAGCELARDPSSNPS